MEREEKRRNDGVAIKYTTCSGEYAACCWESAIWPRIRAPSLHLSPSYFSNSLQTVSRKTTPPFFICPILSHVTGIFEPLRVAFPSPPLQHAWRWYSIRITGDALEEHVFTSLVAGRNMNRVEERVRDLTVKSAFYGVGVGVGALAVLDMDTSLSFLTAC